MSTNSPRPVSDLAIPPGEVLAEDIAARGISQMQLASLLGLPASMLGDVITGKAAVTHEIATKLSDVLGIEASYWINLEAGYREFGLNR